MAVHHLELHALKRADTDDRLSNLLADPLLDALTRIELLSTLLPFSTTTEVLGKKTSRKEYARQEYRAMLLGAQDVITGRPVPISAYLAAAGRQMHALGLDAAPGAADLAALPPFTVFLEFTFTLVSAFLSRDDDALYIIDNPVRKEKVFGVPCVAASSWKGSLRHAITRLALDALRRSPRPADPQQLDALAELLWPLRRSLWRLFGNENEASDGFFNAQIAEWLLKPDDDKHISDADRAAYAAATRELQARIADAFTAHLVAQGYRAENVEGRRGRLEFFPTFFERIGLEMINPHTRTSGVGTQPIYFECVPAGTKGRFSLLYSPYDCPGGPGGPPVPWRSEVGQDLQQLAGGLAALFNGYGFGAKTSDGYGQAAVEIEGGRLLARPYGATRQVTFADFDGLPAAAAELAGLLTLQGGGA